MKTTSSPQRAVQRLGAAYFPTPIARSPLPIAAPRARGVAAAWLLILATPFLIFLGGCAEVASRPGPKRLGGAYGPPATSASAEVAMDRRVADSRPGLGTGWGEERDSQVSRTGFVRAEGNSPAAVDRIYYNDRAGLDAMLAHEGGRERGAGGLVRMAAGLVSAGLRDDSGGWLDGYWAGGRRLIAGERGGRYEIVVRNDTRDRLEIVLSVDGLDVMDGRGASFRKRGYIVHAGDTLTVDGFRTSSSTVAAFRFSRVNRSYAALKHGDTRNVGVIGLAVFSERDPEVWRRRGANPFPGSRWATPPE
ncbi:MAG: hypothetical protein QOE70_3862 [Chthoniobacter sp.]|jgi:hypothetical protein|nr:hypothetical protein [Chthoniobacter sp.]